MPKDLETLRAELESAKAARDAHSTAETREAYKNAWNALEDATPRRKGRGGFACRAGQRQFNERQAAVAENRAAAARKSRR